MNSFKTPQGKELPLLDLHGKAYLQVAYRIVWFRDAQPGWGIVTHLLEKTQDYALFRAEIVNESGKVMSTGTQDCYAKEFNDYVAKAETSAIGRALAHCGFGTAHAPDIDEGERLADAPVPSTSKPTVIASASAWNKGNPVGRILKLCEDRGWQKKDAGELCKEKFGDWQFSNLNHEQTMWLMETINTKTFLTAMADLKKGTKDMLKSNPPSSMFEDGDPGLKDEDIPF